MRGVLLLALARLTRARCSKETLRSPPGPPTLRGPRQLFPRPSTSRARTANLAPEWKDRDDGPVFQWRQPPCMEQVRERLRGVAGQTHSRKDKEMRIRAVAERVPSGRHSCWLCRDKVRTIQPGDKRVGELRVPQKGQPLRK